MHTDATNGLTAILVFGAMLAVHGLGDLWIQTQHQASHKGLHTHRGQWACARHVTTYTAATLVATLAVLALPLGIHASVLGIAAGQAFSAVTHYAVDRRWTLARLAHWAGKTELHRLGQPRGLHVHAVHITATATTRGGQLHTAEETVLVPLDNPVLGTGAHSLDQSLHVGALFVSALLTALI
ncbi:MAG TPA: transcriptional regulator [Streptomyces sp.]